MSLFIGNISNSISSSELEKTFNEFGRCSINYKGTYAFAEFDNEKDAEEAMNHLQKKNMGGRELNIEWSKKSKKYDESKRHRRDVSPRGRCFNCGGRGHYARDCKERRRSRSRSRNHSRRYRRSGSRSRHHRHHRSRSSSRSSSSVSRSPRRSYRRRDDKDDSRSPSPRKSRSNSKNDNSVSSEKNNITTVKNENENKNNDIVPNVANEGNNEVSNNGSPKQEEKKNEEEQK